MQLQKRWRKFWAKDSSPFCVWGNHGKYGTYRTMYRTVLRYTILHYIILHYTILHNTILHCTVYVRAFDWHPSMYTVWEHNPCFYFSLSCFLIVTIFIVTLSHCSHSSMLCFYVIRFLHHDFFSFHCDVLWPQRGVRLRSQPRGVCGAADQGSAEGHSWGNGPRSACL